MLLTITSSYKSPKDPYASGFVHRRVLSYLDNGIESKVFVLDKKREKENYLFEGVEVTVGDETDLTKFIRENNVSAICIHFLNYNVIKSLKSLQRKIPIVIFVHGNEALHWYERIFPYTFSGFNTTLKFIKYAVKNTINIRIIKKFLRNTSRNITIVAVSKWMKEKGIKNWKTKSIDWVIIPNIIDTNLFSFNEKSIDQRYKILLIRSFSSGKYANDIAVNVINKLQKYDDFKKFQITIVGDGQHFEKITKKINFRDNIIIKKGFIHQDEIAKLHRDHGLFLCPTRQDAQGVSMCEAMASGLIPITLNNTAIPEFLPPNYASENEDQMVLRIRSLVEDKRAFTLQSKEVSNYITEKCSENQTTKTEINLVMEKLK